MKRSALLFCLLSGVWGQSLQPPTPTTLTTSWLNLNKMRWITGGWSAAVVYNSQDVVTYIGSTYVSLRRGNVNHNPLSGAPWWEAISATGGGGGGSVNTVFGRIGNISAQGGDYTAAQVTNAVDATQSYNDPGWLAGIAWSKVLSKPTFYNQRIQYGGVNQVQRANLNFGSSFSVTDSLGNDRTTVDLTGTISANTSGNAATATALATTPSQAAINQFCTGITAVGNCNSSYVDWSQLRNSPNLYFQTIQVGGSDQAQHGKLNLIQGSNVTITTSDNQANNSVDVTIDSTGSGGGGYAILSSDGTPLAARSQANFSTEFSLSDNSGAGLTEIGLNSVAAGKVTGLAASATTNALDMGNAAAGLLALVRGGTAANLSGTGGASQVLVQESVGGAVGVRQLTAGDFTGFAASATVNTRDASNINAGTLAGARLPQFTGGQVTSPSAGSVVLNIGTGQVTNAMLAGSIDAATKLSGILWSSNGGTSNGFTAFSGPAGSVKTFTLPNVSTTIVTTQDAGSVTNAMLAGSIATSKLASKQGTDTNLLTAGTVSGTGAPLCTDANGGATTAGCSAGAGTVTVVGAGNLTSTALVTGGGTQTLQTPAATATMDASGNIQTPGTIQAGYGGSTAGAWAFIAGTASAAPANSVGYQAPTSVTSPYRITLPGAPAAGVVTRTNATPSVESIVAYAQAATASTIAQRNSSGEVIAANTVATGKTAMATDTVLAEAQEPAHDGDVTNSAGDLTLTIAANAVTPAKASAVMRTRTLTFVANGSGTSNVLQDTDDQPAIWYNSLGQGVTITAVSCKTDSATATRIQLQRDDGSPANILTDNSGAGLDCSSTRASGTLSGTEKAIASTHAIDFVIVSAGGAGKWVSVTITYTLD